MSDYIKREDAINAVNNNRFYENIIEDIESLPAADVRPAVRGKWLPDDRFVFDDPLERAFSCSACRCNISHGAWYAYRFCPRCGAEMEETE